MRRYAQDTDVGIGRSRDQINKLLREWSCESIAWIDDFKGGNVTLQFVVPRKPSGSEIPVTYPVQFTIKLPDDAALKKSALDGRTYCFSQRKFEKLQSERGRREHRVLLLWLKAALEAVAEKLVDFEALFLPFMVGTDGRTVADVFVPNLPRLSGGTVRGLLQ